MLFGIVCTGVEKMDLMGIILLSAALSIDAFNIGISCGLGGVRIGRVPRLVILAVSMAVTGAAVLAGELLRGLVPPIAGKLVGAALMICLGIYMSAGALKKVLKAHAGGHRAENERESNRSDNSRSERNMITDTVRMIGDAAGCDTDGSKTIDCREAVMIGAALSADSFAAGLGAGICAGEAMFIPLLCGIFQLVFLWGGERLARSVRRFSRIKPEFFGFAAGGVLVLTAIIRLVA